MKLKDVIFIFVLVLYCLTIWIENFAYRILITGFVLILVVVQFVNKIKKKTDFVQKDIVQLMLDGVIIAILLLSLITFVLCF